MSRMALKERLQAGTPEEDFKTLPVMNMTLQGLVNLLKECVPGSEGACYRLLRCTDAGVDIHASLPEVAHKAGEAGTAGDRIIYGVCVGAFLKIAE